MSSSIPTNNASSSMSSSYKPPRTGLLSHLPSPWIPYAELVRLDRPNGILYFWFPYIFGTLYAACVSQPVTPLRSFLTVNAILFGAVFMLRGAAVAFNDIMDRDIDGKVDRTQNRPMARGAVSPREGYLVATAHLLVWFGIMRQLLPDLCQRHALIYTVLHTIYPLTKRVTDYTPVFLGFTFAWGVCVGAAALGLNPTLSKPLYFLYIANVLWTTVYESIYQYQDLDDDIKAGIHSMAVRYRNSIKALLSLAAVLQVLSLAATGVMIGAGPIYFVGACGFSGVSLMVMIRRAVLTDASSCGWWFRNGLWFVGGSLTLGLLGEYSSRLGL